MPHFRIALVLCLVLAPLAARAQIYDRPNLADPAYTACQSDDECKLINPACSAPITVNARHLGQVDIWYKHIAGSMRCDPDMPLPTVNKMACVAHRCTLDLKQPAPVVPDNSRQAKDPTYCDKDAECTVVLGDCCEKNFVNTKNAPRMKRAFDYNAPLAKCFFPDRRHVKNLRCENHKCTGDLEVPNEMRDPTHSTKDHCEQ